MLRTADTKTRKVAYYTTTDSCVMSFADRRNMLRTHWFSKVSTSGAMDKKFYSANRHDTR